VKQTRPGKRSGPLRHLGLTVGLWLGFHVAVVVTLLALSAIPPGRRLRAAVFCVAAGIVVGSAVAVPVEVMLDRRRRRGRGGASSGPLGGVRRGRH
jgi:hypothetical protein